MENKMADLIHSVLPTPRRKIACIHPDDSLKKSIHLMAQLDIGALVVLDAKGKLAGILSERDIVRACLNKDLIDLEHTKVSEIVHKKITILSSRDLIETAMEAMTATKRRHVLIRDEGENLTAIISIGDLLYHLLEDKTRVIEQLENYIHTY
jgi:CBS domain-containing protein